MKTKNTLAVLFAVVMMSVTSMALVSDGSDAAGTPNVLVDMGNGETRWIRTEGSGSAFDVICEALDSEGITYSTSGTAFTVEGISNTTIGAVRSAWNYYEWHDGWEQRTLASGTAYNGTAVALGFYPAGAVPTETPDHMSSWTMTRGDSAQSAHQYVVRESEKEAFTAFEVNYRETGDNFVCGSVLVGGNTAFVIVGGGAGVSAPDPALIAYDMSTFKELWRFEYPKGVGYETATGVIYGGYYFLPATNGHIYKIPVSGPGTDVETIDIPLTRDHALIGNTYASGPSSITYDSGVLFFGTSNGYVYAVDPGLTSADGGMKVIWRTQLGGCIYYTNVTIDGGLLYAGALNGHLYVLDKKDGTMLADTEVFTYTNNRGVVTGSVSVPVVSGGDIYMPFSDGRGMNSVLGGIAVYRYDRDTGVLTQKAINMDIGLPGNFLLPFESQEFTGVYFVSMKIPLGRMASDGTYTVLNDELETPKAGLVLVNDDRIFMADYKPGGYVSAIDLEGNVIGRYQQPESVRYFCMSAPTVMDNMYLVGTDGGFYAVAGYITLDGEEPATGISPAAVFMIILAVIAVAFAAVLIYISKTKDGPPAAYIKNAVAKRLGLSADGVSRTKRNKRRLAIVLIIGLILAVAMFMLCISFGPYGSVSVPDALSALVSAIGKHGNNLTDLESAVYDSRLPRAIAAAGVGMGLAIAGSVYQAVIRNPLVDPYIMGVSSGAGMFAVAALAANFTFFGLLEVSNYSTPILASFGGITAFFITMLLASKAGGSSSSYVLAGVVVGLAFSSIMTIMLVTAESDKLHSALTWLYGSFANVGWDIVWILFFPALTMSIIPLFWAKELNLVLLGEEQAQQMGLNVKRFSRWMLILASVLTSVCVAFVGIIGFVGLVVPHICRMFLGGDHRLVLPASMVAGAALMLFADLLARMVMMPMELPVGAITTIIGVPLFAYLLIRKGRMYDG